MLRLLLAMTGNDDRRTALRQTMKAMRASIRSGRPVTLPNLLRLHRRHCADRHLDPATDQTMLRQWYLRWQPHRW